MTWLCQKLESTYSAVIIVTNLCCWASKVCGRRSEGLSSLIYQLERPGIVVSRWTIFKLGEQCHSSKERCNYSWSCTNKRQGYRLYTSQLRSVIHWYLLLINSLHLLRREKTAVLFSVLIPPHFDSAFTIYPKHQTNVVEQQPNLVPPMTSRKTSFSAPFDGPPFGL